MIRSQTPRVLKLGNPSFFMEGKSKDLAQGGKCRELTHIDHHGLALCYIPHGLMTAMFTQHDGSLKGVSSPFTLRLTHLGLERLSDLPRVVPVTQLNKNLSCFRTHTISTGCFLQVVGP